MLEIAATALLFALAMLGLALGVLAGRKPLRGSCGGVTACPCTPERRARCLSAAAPRQPGPYADDGARALRSVGQHGERHDEAQGPEQPEEGHE